MDVVGRADRAGSEPTERAVRIGPVADVRGPVRERDRTATDVHEPPIPRHEQADADRRDAEIRVVGDDTYERVVRPRRHPGRIHGDRDVCLLTRRHHACFRRHLQPRHVGEGRQTGFDQVCLLGCLGHGPQVPHGIDLEPGSVEVRVRVRQPAFGLAGLRVDQPDVVGLRVGGFPELVERRVPRESGDVRVIGTARPEGRSRLLPRRSSHVVHDPFVPPSDVEGVGGLIEGETTLADVGPPRDRSPCRRPIRPWGRCRRSRCRHPRSRARGVRGRRPTRGPRPNPRPRAVRTHPCVHRSS